MTLLLRIVLIVASVLTTVLILRKIRQSKLQIEDSLFWIGFSFMLILFSVFPIVPTVLAELAGTYSTSNFIFLFVIFLLISVEIVKYQLAACGIILDHADSNIAHCNLPVLSFAPHHCLA